MNESRLDPTRYRCIRCRAAADVIFKGMLPYCFLHEPLESKTARQPKEDAMKEDTKPTSTFTSVAPVDVVLTPTVPQTISVGGGWVVKSKDGTELKNGFESKKDASKWASLEVENKRLKAGQYKIKKSN